MKFLARHYYKGAWYSLNFQADSWADAEEVCSRHSLTLDGEHKFTLVWPFTILARMILR
jgi:hypothetical protein